MTKTYFGKPEDTAAQFNRDQETIFSDYKVQDTEYVHGSRSGGKVALWFVICLLLAFFTFGISIVVFILGLLITKPSGRYIVTLKKRKKRIEN